MFYIRTLIFYHLKWKICRKVETSKTPFKHIMRTHILRWVLVGEIIHQNIIVFFASFYKFDKDQT